MKQQLQIKNFLNNHSALPKLIMIALITILTIAITTACTNEEVTDPQEEKNRNHSEEKSESEQQVDEKKSETDKENEQNEQSEEIDYQKVQPNELGEIMILMYHQIGDEEQEWQRTRENFRDDLERLYEKDYRLVNLMDVVRGEIDLPPGKTPVVLTFDDASEGQFGYTEKDGERVIDPDTAVGIILDMKEKYDDFTVGGTFYVNYIPVPFRDSDLHEEKIAHLDELGFEIGNHGYNHKNLQNLNAQGVQEELALPHKYTEKIISDYNVESLALAFGAWPDDSQKEYVFSGEYDGITYEHKAVLNVGAEPAQSPFHKDFDALDLPRVRADQTRMDQWLEYYEENPEKRYISDGFPETVTIPEKLEGELAEEITEDDHWEIKTYSFPTD